MDAEGSSFDSEGGVSTVGSLWHEVAGRRLGDELMECAPDLFAFTDVLLDRSEAYRFAVSTPVGAGWPPPQMPDRPLAIADAGADGAPGQTASRPTSAESSPVNGGSCA